MNCAPVLAACEAEIAESASKASYADVAALSSRCAAAIPLLAKRKQCFIAERKERSAERREHFQLILRPLDRSQRVAERDHETVIMRGLLISRMRDVGAAKRSLQARRARHRNAF